MHICIYIYMTGNSDTMLWWPLLKRSNNTEWQRPLAHFNITLLEHAFHSSHVCTPRTTSNVGFEPNHSTVRLQWDTAAYGTTCSWQSMRHIELSEWGLYMWDPTVSSCSSLLSAQPDPPRLSCNLQPTCCFGVFFNRITSAQWNLVYERTTTTDH